MIAVAAFLIAISGDMPPAKEVEIPEEHMIEVEVCHSGLGQCAVRIEVLKAYVEKRVAMAAELEKLRKIKGCGKLEVVPKPRKPGA